MSPAGSRAARVVRFGVFEADLHTRELRKRGVRMKLQEKPFQLLELLLEKAGELVTRKEVANRLWPGIYVNFDRSLNTAVNALRRALGDSSRNPRFLETRAGLGYRFIAPVERSAAPEAEVTSRNLIESLAVLPFQNETGDRALEDLTLEIPAGIIAAASGLEGLRVAGRSAAFSFRGSEVDPVQAGETLRVCTVLTGKFWRHGGSLNTSIDLVDSRSGRRVWSDRIEVAAGAEIPPAQRISNEIFARLGPRLERRRRRGGLGIARPEARQDYLRGRYFAAKMTADALRQAIAYFNAAIEDDPDYAQAYAGLADAYILMGLIGAVAPKNAFPKAKELALKSLRLDESAAEGHVALAAVRAFYEWDWSGAGAEYRTAIESDPDHAAALQGYGKYFCVTGRMDEAISTLQRAREIDPLSLSIGNDYAWMLYMARDYEGALRQAWMTLTVEPRFAAAQLTLGLANEQLGNFEDAIVEFHNASVCSSDWPAALAALAHAHIVAGQRDEAMQTIKKLQDIGRDRYVSPYCLSLVDAAGGDADAAFRLLARAVQERDAWVVWLAVDPRFDPLRRDRRFVDLIARIGPLPAESC